MSSEKGGGIGVTGQQCIKCKKYKSDVEFRKYRNICKECNRKYKREWYKKNIQHCRKYQCKWAEIHKKQRKEYYEKNKKHILKRCNRWRSKNRNRVNYKRREYGNKYPWLKTYSYI